MSDRIKPREILENPDAQLISSFGGLSSASGNATGDIVYQDKLINAFVNKRGEISTRCGSQVNSVLSMFENSTGNGVQKFTFDNTNYMVVKAGNSVYLLATKDGVNYTTYRSYNAVLSGNAANDKPSFAIKIEGDYCHVLLACANSQMISVTIVKSSLSNVSITGNTMSANLRVPVTGSVITASNSLIRQGSLLFQPTTATHNNASISVTSSNVSQIDISKPIIHHSFFVLRFTDAQYLPGLYFNNSAVRKNQIPLDVNVSIPQELRDNPIVNEPTQLLDRETLQVYEGTNKRTKVSNRQPANSNEWDFSDGGYLSGVGMFTNQSPAFVSFGGFSTMATNGSATTISLYRLRQVIAGSSTNVFPGGLTGNLRTFVDKALVTPVYYDSNMNVIATNGVRPRYFGFPNTNVNLAAVVELVDVTPTLLGTSFTTVVNLDPNDGAIVIGDTYVIPLYGYSFNVKDGIYPSAIAFVGNRLVMASRDSRVIYSSANWSYRGISFNNCQISTIGFNETSAFSVNVGQATSVIMAFKSINGVVVVGTDTGVYRISSSTNAARPANATDAVASKISSEIVTNSDCFSVFDNRVYYISSNGLYSLEYSNEASELVNSSMSTNVSDKFASANSLSYVEELRSFLVSFNNSNEILALNVDSNSWYTIKFATSAKAIVFDDCFLFSVPGESAVYLLVCSFSRTLNTDLLNLNNPSVTLPKRSVTITHMPTNVDALVCPAEFVQTMTTNKVALASGDNHVRLIGADSLLLTENDTNVISAYLVTKAFFGGRLDQSSRVSSVSLMCAGVGSVSATIVHPSNDYVDRSSSITTWQFTSSTYQGEPMLNAAYPTYSIRTNAGDTNVLTLRQLGIQERWQLGIKLSDVRLLGMQFITNVKSRKRLR